MKEFLRNLFRTRYRIVHTETSGSWFSIYSRNWYSFKWERITGFSSLKRAKELISEQKCSDRPNIVHEE